MDDCLNISQIDNKKPEELSPPVFAVLIGRFYFSIDNNSISKISVE